jgi:hypothetical protein
VHQLGASPHEVRISIRSLTSAPSGALIAQVLSWNASQATITFGASPLGAGVAAVDVIAEFTHTLSQ